MTWTCLPSGELLRRLVSQPRALPQSRDPPPATATAVFPSRLGGEPGGLADVPKARDSPGAAGLPRGRTSVRRLYTPLVALGVLFRVPTRPTGRRSCWRSSRTLYYWAKHGILDPSVSNIKPRLWSYNDVLALRLIDWLRSDKEETPFPRASMQQIRQLLSSVQDLGHRLERGLQCGSTQTASS